MDVTVEHRPWPTRRRAVRVASLVDTSQSASSLRARAAVSTGHPMLSKGTGNVITSLTPDSWRYEQSFSEDGGKTWEVNWIAIDTRVKG
jgi:hypothetical protein